MKTNLSLLFRLKSKKAVNAQSAVYLRITIDGQRTEIATGIKCEQDKWCPKSGRIKGTKESIKHANANLDKLQSKVHQAVEKLERLDEEVNVENVKFLLLGKSPNKKNIVEIYNEHNLRIKALLNNGFSKGTLQRHETTAKHLKDFINSCFKRSDIPVNKIDHKFITDFEFYIRTERSCANNTTVKYIKNFKKIITECRANGWIQADPFINHKIRLKVVNREFLNEEELIKIAETDFQIPRLNAVRDVFLFSCYTGLAYIDVQQLMKHQIVTGPDGNPWLSTTRQKTNTATKVPLLPPAITLIESYKNDPTCLNKGKVFPVSSNQKMNAYLKEIANICGISKTLTYHIARHTFATTVTLANGVSIESVSKMLGHTSIKTTQHYAKILDLKVGEDMSALREKFKLF